MFNAMYKFGYKFNILRGYLFEQGYIFNEYVNSLYEIKCTSKKDEPMYLISKLLLNSLYGKFGMHQDTFLTQHGIVNDDELYAMIDHNIIIDSLPLRNNKQLISFISDKDQDINLKINNLNQNMNISPYGLGLSAAITAYARIHMSQFKQINNKFTLLYTRVREILIVYILINL
jgi:DNA polymerase type B, organellar and viral